MGDLSTAKPHRTEAEIARFGAFTSISHKDREALLRLARGFITVEKGQHLREQGDKNCGLYLLVSGWTASTIEFANGSRLIVKVHMPGDMLGSPSLALHEAADSIVALTDAKVVVLSLQKLGDLFSTNPRLAAILFLISQEERVFLMDRLAAVARLSAIGRLAAIILQLHSRVVRNDPDAGNTFEIPLTQGDIADLVGTTTVHINRMVQELRRRKVFDWKRPVMKILDVNALRVEAKLPSRVVSRNLSWLPAGG